MRHRYRNLTLFVVLPLAFAACAETKEGDEPDLQAEVTGPTMRPGWNCLSCHREENPDKAPVWSAAGTVYATADAAIDQGLEGVAVILTDANGQVVRLVTNTVGNFYTAEPLAAPFNVLLEYEGRQKAMPMSPPAGSCNACHAQPPISGAPGRIVAP